MLDADVVEIDAAVHARALCRLGHDDELRLVEELADFRRGGDELIAAEQEPHFRRAQQAEAGVEPRLERVLAVGVGVVARAEQGEIVGGDPLQKLDRFGDLVGRQRRRRGAQFRGDLAQARQHRPPILHAHAHLGEDVGERAHKVGARRGVAVVIDMDVNEAFAPAITLVRPMEGVEFPRLAALDREYRVDQQADVETAFTDLADDRVDQERHVVVDDFEHRHARLRRGRLEADFWGARFALLEQRPRLLGDAREFFRPVAREILGDRMPEQLGDEIQRDVAVAPGEHRGGGSDQRRPGAIAVRGRESIVHVHVRHVALPRHGCDFGRIIHGTHAPATRHLYCRLYCHRS